MKLLGKKEADTDNSSSAKNKTESPCLTVTIIKHIEMKIEAEKQALFELMASWLPQG